MTLTSGDGVSSSGNVAISSGASAAGDSGGLTLSSGASYLDAGDISIIAGSSTNTEDGVFADGGDITLTIEIRISRRVQTERIDAQMKTEHKSVSSWTEGQGDDSSKTENRRDADGIDRNGRPDLC